MLYINKIVHFKFSARATTLYFTFLVCIHDYQFCLIFPKITDWFQMLLNPLTKSKRFVHLISCLLHVHFVHTIQYQIYNQTQLLKEINKTLKYFIYFAHENILVLKEFTFSYKIVLKAHNLEGSSIFFLLSFFCKRDMCRLSKQIVRSRLLFAAQHFIKLKNIYLIYMLKKQDSRTDLTTTFSRHQHGFCHTRHAKNTLKFLLAKKLPFFVCRMD